MTHAHNCLLRSLNSILLQGPCIADTASTSKTYNPDDVQDLLFYTSAFIKSVQHHHHFEETLLFPDLAVLPGVPPTLFAEPIEEHKAFHAGAEALQTYCVTHLASPSTHRWETMNSILTSFAPPLTHHLASEISLLLSLEPLTDSAAVWQCWTHMAKAAMKETTFDDFFNVAPIMIGSADYGFEFGNSFPEMPYGMAWVVHYYFARRGTRPGAWRFCPSDFWGRKRALTFLGETAGG